MGGRLVCEIKGASNDVDLCGRQVAAVVLLNAVHGHQSLQLGTPEQSLCPQQLPSQHGRLNKSVQVKSKP